MRRALVIATCAAATALIGGQASAQVLPPPAPPQQADSVDVLDIADVWAGLKALGV
ncbi:hypothetical protein GCM10023148_52230 [Actinokineospora soli]